jgi:HK97 family phage major capsid protein
VVRAGLGAMIGAAERRNAEQVIAARYGSDARCEATKHITAVLTLTRATQNAAMTVVPEWAGALIREGTIDLLDELQPESVVARLPVQRGSFDDVSSVTMISRQRTAPEDPNLAAAFRGEGAPIRVGSVILQGKKLTPKSMGVIGHFSEELAKRSTRNIESLIRDWIVGDTTTVLDALFFGSQPADEIIPAGLASGLAAGDTAVSTGNTPAQVDADIKARISAMLAHRLGRRPVWVMNSAHALGLASMRTAAGTLLYPTMSESPPSLFSIAVEHSPDIPAGTVFLIDAAEVGLAFGAPSFTASNGSMLNEEYDAAAVAPIVDDAGVVAKPDRSLFQTACIALRGIWAVDWLVLRPGAVQTITSVTW